MESDAIRLTSAFLKLVSKEALRDKKIALCRLEGGTFALAIANPDFKKSAITLIDVPDEFFELDELDFLLHIDALVAIRVALALRASKANEKRTQEQRRASAQKAIRARWAKKGIDD